MLLLLLASLLSISSVADFSMSPPLEPGTIELPGFDPALGELVRLELFVDMAVGGDVTFPDPPSPTLPWTLSFSALFSGPGIIGGAYRPDSLLFDTGGTFPFGYGSMTTRIMGMSTPLTFDPHPGLLGPTFLLSMDVDESAFGATELTVIHASGQVFLEYFYEPAAVAEPGVGLLMAAAALLLSRRSFR
jgi:hypothetical protein